MPICHINADDFGLHRDIDAGIVKCAEAGRLSGVSLSPNGSSVDWSLARELASRVDVGVHVTLVGEAWLTEKKLFPSWSRLMPWLLLPGRRTLLEREIRCQIELMMQNEIRPTHLDSHQHVHVMNPIWTICQRLAAEFGIHHLRVPATPSRAIAKPTLAGGVLQRLCEKRARQTPRALACIGIANAGHNTGTILDVELAAASGADIELVAHPACDTPSLRERYGFWQFDWNAETDALLGDSFGQSLQRNGYEIGMRSAIAGRA